MSSEDIIENALEAANTGDPLAGTRMLWPLIPKNEHRDEALFALAFCFEKANNFATAHYLYSEIVELYPDFESAKKRVEKCRAIVDERGLIEEFSDIGHRECISCKLRYRSEYYLCPYCGIPKDQTKAYTEASSLDDEEVKTKWEDPSILSSIQEMGRDAADRVQEFVESDTVKDISGKVQTATKSTINKAKEMTDKKKIKEVADRGSEVGKDVMDKADKLSQNAGLRDVAKKIENLSWQASDAMKNLIKGEKTTTDGSGRGSGGNFADQAKELGKSILRNVRDAIDPDKDKRDH